MNNYLRTKIDTVFDLTPIKPNFGIGDVIKSSFKYLGEILVTIVAICVAFFTVEELL